MPATVTPPDMAPTSPPLPPSPPALAVGDWSALHLPTRRGDNVTSLAAFDHGFVAVGFHCANGDFCQHPVALGWTSDDGSTWQRHRIDEPTDTAIMSVAVDGTRLVGVGNAWRGGRWRTTALISNDGTTWQETGRIASAERGEAPCYHDPAPGFCDASIFLSGGSILVIGGGFATSTDGHEWLAFDPAGPASPFRTEGGWLQPNFAARPHGFVAAAVSGGPPSEVCMYTGPPHFWASADGRTWQAGSVEPEPDPQMGHSLDRLSAGANGFTALGGAFAPCGEGPVTPACWSSADGVHWTGRDEGPIFVQGLLPAGNGMVAIALDNAATQLWFSPGDCTWQQADSLNGSFDGPLVAADDSHIVVMEGFGLTGVVSPRLR